MLWYPLIPVPLSLCHPDGTMQNTLKSKQLFELEKRINSCSSVTIDVRIADVMVFLHLSTSLLIFAPYIWILKQVFKQRDTEIHLLFDKTISPFIKDFERNNRDNNRQVAHQITGSERKLPCTWLQSLRVDQFNGALVGSKKVFVNSGDMCFSFCNEDTLMVKRNKE